MATIPPPWRPVPARYVGHWQVEMSPGAWGSPSPGQLGDDSYAEFYRGFGSLVMLYLFDADPNSSSNDVDELVSGGDSEWAAAVLDPVTRRWYDLVEKGTCEQPDRFGTRAEALDAAARIARVIESSRGIRRPDWRGEDVGTYLKWFLAQHPNQADYVRLFWNNDRNGAFDGLLGEPVSASEEVFGYMFEDEGPFTFPSARHRQIFGAFGGSQSDNPRRRLKRSLLR